MQFEAGKEVLRAKGSVIYFVEQTSQMFFCFFCFWVVTGCPRAGANVFNCRFECIVYNVFAWPQQSSSAAQLRFHWGRQDNVRAAKLQHANAGGAAAGARLRVWLGRAVAPQLYVWVWWLPSAAQR